MRTICCGLMLWVCLGVLTAQAQTVEGIWEGLTEGGPGTLRVDFDNEAASLNGGAVLVVTKLPDAPGVQFNVAAAGAVFPFVGEWVEGSIVGKIGSWPISFARLPDSTPPLLRRQVYPLPESVHAAARDEARSMALDIASKQELPGLSLAVARHGVVVWSEGFGMADVEQGVPVTSRTLFRVGSVSKLLTAAGLARLVEDGRLDLDAPVQQYVPDFPAKQWPVTPRQLAAHMSGIRHYGDQDVDTWLKGAPHFATVGKGLEIFRDDPLQFEPGTDYLYSSYGYNLLSAAIEGAAGEEFLSFMQHSILEPLGLRDIVPDHALAIIPGRASFYAREAPGQPLEHAPHVDNSYKWASGGYLASTEDLVRFGSAHLQTGFFRQETLDLLFTPVTGIPSGNQVGIAWNLGQTSGGQTNSGQRFYYHAGTIEGGRAILLVVPDSGLVVAMAANILAPFGALEAYRIGMLFAADE